MMTDVEQVKERLLLITPLTEERLEQITPLVEESLCYTTNILREGVNPDDPRIGGIAAAYCACQLSYLEAGDAASSFSAGDVRITCGDASQGYRELLSLYIDSAPDLLKDTGFQFCTV